MGYILLRESMLDSVIRARDRWLKPDGAMFPSHATMFWGAVSFEEDRISKQNEYETSMRDWHNFSSQMKGIYNVDMGVLTAPYEKEQADYYIFSSLWTELSPENLVGQPVVIKRLDLNTCTLADSEDLKKVPYDITIPFPVRISGFAGWFTVDFNGSIGSPAVKRVNLSTGPEEGYTHWGQQVFYLKDAVDCSLDTRIHGSVSMLRQEKNKRLYNLHLEVAVDDIESKSFVYEIP